MFIEFLHNYFQKIACCHEWEEKYSTKIFEKESDKLPIARKVTLVCKKCGEIKQIRI